MTYLTKRLDRLTDQLPAHPDRDGIMPRPPRDFGELGNWVERSYGFRCSPTSIWKELARKAQKGIAHDGTIH
jgi:hypothetical protein